jgi:hypothetical protein
MVIDTGLIFSMLSALVTLGSLCVGFGILKGKLDHAIEENVRQGDQIKNCATKDEVESVARRATEDRERNSDQHKQLFDATNIHAKQIGELDVTLRLLKESFDKLQMEIRSGIESIQRELRELRK